MSTPSSAALATSVDILPEELGLAHRNHSFLLEGLRHDVTPLGMHYLLIHSTSRPRTRPSWKVAVGGLVRNALSLIHPRGPARPRTASRCR